MKYIDLIGWDYTEFIKTKKDIILFEEMIDFQEKTKGLLLKDCIVDFIAALKISRILRGMDPEEIVLAKTPLEGLARIQAFSKITQN